MNELQGVIYLFCTRAVICVNITFVLQINCTQDCSCEARLFCECTFQAVNIIMLAVDTNGSGGMHTDSSVSAKTPFLVSL